METERIHIEGDSLRKLKDALEKAGENYKENFARLTNLIEEITSGDIQGDPATDLLNKYNEKETAFKALLNEINTAEEYTGAKGRSFTEMVNELKARAK